jgi:catechol 2,3-dioxygenase-like lactoylglutathione lyase family enzyme
MINTRGLRHIQIVVRNMDRTLAFWHELLGMEELFRTEDAIFATVPGGGDVLTLVQTPEGRDGDSAGLKHFGFELVPPVDVDDIVEQIKAAGGIIQSSGERAAGIAYIYFTDLDGYTAELYVPDA